MNRDQKAAVIAEIAAQIEQSQAILAIDYRGISVPQVAELRAGLRQADTTFRVVKNSLTERAADQSGAEVLKPLLIGPTALAFVRGDVASAAKAIADYGRSTQLLPFKGGLMDGTSLDPDQLRALSRLPPREVLYGQLVGMVAAPVGGLVRSLSALLGGLAVALGQVREKMQSGELPSGAPDGSQDASAGAPQAKAAGREAEQGEGEGEGAAAPAAQPADEQQPERQPSANEQQAPEQQPTDAQPQPEAQAEGAGASASGHKQTGPADEPAQQPDADADASRGAPQGGPQDAAAQEE